MAKAIVARRKGDEYQARVFWLKLLKLRTGDCVESVTLESDLVSFVDDVVVSYCKPLKDPLTGKEVVHELFQCKYHMTEGNAFDHENLVDPDFIKCQSSMLQRLYDAYVKLSEELGADTFRLYIFSNWHWDHRDEVAKHLHEGMIRSTFYEKGSRSKRGMVRSKWTEHLSISEEKLRAFLDTVRFDLGRNLTHLAENMKAALESAGLKPINTKMTGNVYDDLAWKLFGQGRNSFDRDSFNQMVREEDLIPPPPTDHSKISIQSVSRLAWKPRDDHVAHLDLCEFFDRRFPKDDSYWKQEIPERISAFMLNEDLGDSPQPIHFFFDCHLSIAFLAGSIISPKHRIQIIPTQTNGSDYTLWEPKALDTNDDLWQFKTVGEIDKEVVLGISVTHQIHKQLQPYLETEDLNDLPQILVCPTAGVSRSAVSDGAHAWELGHQLADQLRERLPHSCRTIHLFFAGPVALGYILGHTLRYITRFIQLYEYDFEGQRGVRKYYPSLRVPYQP